MTSLYKAMETEYGVGRTAVDTSRKALVKAGLIAEYGNERDNRNLRVVNLTALGEAVSSRLNELAELIERQHI